MTTEQVFYASPTTYRYFNAYTVPGIKKHMNRNAEEFIDHVLDTVLKYKGKTLKQLSAKSRKRELVFARQECMYFLKSRTTLSLKTIGEMFGGRDHTTTIHSIHTINDLMDSDPAIRKEIWLIDSLI